MKKTKTTAKSLVVSFFLLFISSFLASCGEKEWWQEPEYYRLERNIFVGQEYNYTVYCTHDLSYEEPMYPDGKYYGKYRAVADDENPEDCPFYIEVTENKYLQIKPVDESCSLEEYVKQKYEKHKAWWEETYPDTEIDCTEKKYLADSLILKCSEKTEFKAITQHGNGDVCFTYLKWEDFPHRTKDAYVGEKYLPDYSSYFAMVKEDDEGTPTFIFGLYEFSLERS